MTARQMLLRDINGFVTGLPLTVAGETILRNAKFYIENTPELDSSSVELLEDVIENG